MAAVKIFILRHGEAEPESTSDEKRQLTAVGRKNTERVGTWLSQNSQITKIYASPFVRTRQTADIISKEISYKGSITYLDSLKHFASPGQVWTDIVETEGEILLVSHMPLVSRLVQHLTGDDRVGFSTSGLCCVEDGALLFYRDV
ncbi:phosphohistidine phosphatase SixA [bacterium]|nr:phosphohistidine phosphatase SixA [bacterium]